MAADPSIDAAEAVALFRYKLIAEAANPRLGPAERGQFVRELASQPGRADGWSAPPVCARYVRSLAASLSRARAGRSEAGTTCGPGPCSPPPGAVGGSLPATYRSPSAFRGADQCHPAGTPRHPGGGAHPSVSTSNTVVFIVPLWRSSRTSSVASKPRGRTSSGSATC